MSLVITMDENHNKFMTLAIEQAQTAYQKGEFPVGCVMVSEGAVVASGMRANTMKGISEMDHGEMVALRNVLEGSVTYDISRITVYATMEPCLMCYATLILNGVRKIVYGYEDVMGGGTNLPLSQLNPLYNEMNIEVLGRVMRHESLHLFKQFFKNPANNYWKDSLLAQYTLNQ